MCCACGRQSSQIRLLLLSRSNYSRFLYINVVDFYFFFLYYSVFLSVSSVLTLSCVLLSLVSVLCVFFYELNSLIDLLISLNGCSDSVNGDLQFLHVWEWANFNPSPHKINTPEPIVNKIGTIDYIREGTSYTKFGRNPFTGGFWASGWNITKIIFIYLFIYTFFLWSAYRSDPWMDFYAR